VKFNRILMESVLMSAIGDYAPMADTVNENGAGNGIARRAVPVARASGSPGWETASWPDA
jgi:hypothetical protein